MRRDFSSMWMSFAALVAAATIVAAGNLAHAGEYGRGGYGPRYGTKPYQQSYSRYHGPKVTPRAIGPGRSGYKAPAYYAALKLIDIRWIDAGIPKEKLGPAFRVVVRNVGHAPIFRPFDLLMTACAGDKLNLKFPTAVKTIKGLRPGQTLVINMRLPIESLAMAYPGQKAPAPFNTVTVLASTGQKGPAAGGAVKTLAVLPLAKILPVDIVLARPKSYVFPAGSVMLIKGEGFALAPGKVVVKTAGVALAAEILNWTPLGVEVKLPHLPLAHPTRARLFVVRKDGMTSRPMLFDLDLPVAVPVAVPVAAVVSETIVEQAVEPFAATEAIVVPAASNAPVIAPQVAAETVEPVEETAEVPSDQVQEEPVTTAAQLILSTPPADAETVEPVEESAEGSSDQAQGEPATTAAGQLILSQLNRLLGR